MSEEKSRKVLKLKTFDEIKNDAIYEINLFSKKRRTPFVKLSRLSDEDNNNEEQVRNDNKMIIKQSIYFRLLRIRIMVMIQKMMGTRNRLQQLVKKDKNNERFKIRIKVNI
jgi:hypothetical protein